MEDLQKVIDDIRQGKNISLYVTIIFSILFAILSIFGGLQQYADSLTLAVLALVLNALVVNRRVLEKVYESRKGMSEAGILNAHADLPLDDLDEYFRKAKVEIRILQTYILNANSISPGLIEAAKRGVAIKVLFIDLQSDILKQRLLDLGFNRDSTRPQTGLETVKATIEKHKLNNSHIEIRFFNALPPFPLYVVDEILLYGAYWHGHESTSGPFIEVQGRSSKIGWDLIDTFDRLWSNAKPME